METIQHEDRTSGRCALHPERVALGLCERCGSFYCDGCFKSLAGKRFCSTCLALPGFDYIAETRRRFWGKRDGFVWYFGLLGSIGTLLMFATTLSTFSWLHAATQLPTLGIEVCYLMLLRWSGSRSSRPCRFH